MPLNFNLSKIKDSNGNQNFSHLIDDKYDLKEPYGTIVILTMTVGINNITEKNYKKFYNRINLIEKIQGAYFYDGSIKPLYIKEEEVKAMIGLKTNATNKTKALFLKELFGKTEM